MTRAGEVLEGRTLNCKACNNRRVCSSCGTRIRYGKPNPTGYWLELSMTEATFRRMLLAAAEFDAIAAGHDDKPTAVEFIDWLYPDVVGKAA